MIRIQSMGALLLVAAVLAGCGATKSAYPALRDIPPAPKELTPAAVRDSLKGDLWRERSGEPGNAQPGAARQPAVPPRPVMKPSAGGSSDAALMGAECGLQLSSGPDRTAQIPPLRGTLRTTERLAPEGVSAAVASTGDTALPLQFEPGTADLSAALLKALRAQAAVFLAHGGGEVFIDVRTTAVGEASAARSLDRLQLGLRRASVVADYLIAQGVDSGRIKLLAAEAEGDAPVGRADGAVVTFRGQ